MTCTPISDRPYEAHSDRASVSSVAPTINKQRLFLALVASIATSCKQPKLLSTGFTRCLFSTAFQIGEHYE